MARTRGSRRRHSQGALSNPRTSTMETAMPGQTPTIVLVQAVTATILEATAVP